MGEPLAIDNNELSDTLTLVFATIWTIFKYHSFCTIGAVDITAIATQVYVLSLATFATLVCHTNLSYITVD